ncbi:hypothetical protein Tcan_07581 [Toxocara canis]|uniref:G-protein coupled receptors family 1 profile domain-containing protein n=1 Tax=Toxocara canis TaxID=6265 RepID=A0A0B2VEP3_TOXCA|nr:hypothetical protein Tcan_07581 [Toxocara canis]
MPEEPSDIRESAAVSMVNGQISANDSVNETLTSEASVPLPEGAVFTYETIAVWLLVSQFLYWLVLCITCVTLPLLCYSLSVLTTYRRSHYFPFLMAIIVGDFFMLTTMSTTLIVERYAPLLQGVFMCKFSAFATNASACFVNWSWLSMFLQRFVHIFFPMSSSARRGNVCMKLWFLVIGDSGKLLAVVAMIATLTQAWTPILLTENTLDSVDSVYCGPDTRLVNRSIFKTIAIIESTVTYTLPFVLTLLTDISVLVWRSSTRSQFTLITSEALKQHQHTQCKNNTAKNRLQLANISFKIQSERSIQYFERRRNRSMKRCLLMATTNLLLNLPNFLLQLCDELLNLRLSEANSIFYIYADAIAYTLYMLQFPIFALYTHYLKQDMREKRSSAKSLRSLERSSATSFIYYKNRNVHKKLPKQHH